MPLHISPSSIEEIARELRRARETKGLSQAELGRETGLPQSHISKIEHGRTDLRLSSLLEMARLLDHDIMLIPRKYVPAVRSIRADHAEDEPVYAYAPDEDDQGSADRRSSDHGKPDRFRP